MGRIFRIDTSKIDQRALSILQVQFYRSLEKVKKSAAKIPRKLAGLLVNKTIGKSADYHDLYILLILLFGNDNLESAISEQDFLDYGVYATKP